MKLVPREESQLQPIWCLWAGSAQLGDTGPGFVFLQDKVTVPAATSHARDAVTEVRTPGPAPGTSDAGDLGIIQPAAS